MDTKDKKRQSRPAGRSGTATKTKKPRPAARAKTQSKRPADSQIVYTQPKPFNRNRFLLRMATVVAVVLALVFGMSIS